MTPRLDNRTYYDAMAEGYERERHCGYHAFLDRVEVESVADLARGADVLEVGCGTGLILRRLAPLARRVAGVDLSAEMLRKARDRVPSVVQGSALALPFPDRSFDVAVSFKVLAHIPEVRAAVAEMARVVRPGGHVALEFYNRHSLRALVKRLKPPSSIARQEAGGRRAGGGGVGRGAPTVISDTDVFTRYDSLAEAVSYLPDGAEVVRVHGIRIALPAAFLMKVPIVGAALRFQERLLARTPLRRYGGFLILVARVP